MKKGFTLVELVAAIIILTVIGAIALPIVNSTIKNNKEKLYQAQLQEIEEATEKWAYKNRDLLPNNSETVTITILELKKAGLLPLDIRNPKDGELLPNDMEVTITLKNNVYVYNVNEESGTNIKSEFNENSPILILNGNALEYVEYGSTYSDMGAKAKDKSGNVINNINIMYQYNGTEIASINTEEFKTYTIVYSASSEVNGTIYTSNVTRTVIVRDTTAPDLTVPAKANIALTSASTYNLLNGVTVTDNSGETINVTTTGFNASLGQQVVSYTACDSHNNCVTKKRIVNVLSDDAVNPEMDFVISDSKLTLKPSNKSTTASYVWYKNGIPVSTASEYELTSTGTYQLEVTSGNNVKKSSILDVNGYQLKNDKVLFAAKIDDKCILRRNGSYEIEEFNYNEKCTLTTALNMVKNGYLEYKDNTNFPEYINYDSLEDSLYVSGLVEFYSLDYIPIDYNKTYNQSVEMKSDSQDFNHYAGIVEYDIDKKLITSDTNLFVDNTLTYLTRDLKDGDTVVYLNDISNFLNGESTPYYQLGFIFWNYKDSTGYEYPELSYSRNFYYNIYEYTGIDKNTNTITLKYPWSYGTIETGTKLSQTNATLVYNYGLVCGTSIPNLYTNYSNSITGITYPSYYSMTNFKYGTKYIRFLLWSNYNSNNSNKVYFKNIVITEED